MKSRIEQRSVLIKARLKTDAELGTLYADTSVAIRKLLDVGLDQWATNVLNELIGPEVRFDVKADALTHNANLINAIKVCRAVFRDMGLKEAKEFCEGVRNNPGVDFRQYGAQDENEANTVCGILREAGFRAEVIKLC